MLRLAKEVSAYQVGTASGLHSPAFGFQMRTSQYLMKLHRQ